VRPIRLEISELGLPALDALDVDALAVLVGPERPLQGLAGFADWRLCGLVSRAIRDESYRPDTGEALLLPSGGRIAVPRIFCFGAPEAPRDAASWSAQASRLCQAMHKAGSESWAGALPPWPGGDAPSGAAGRGPHATPGAPPGPRGAARRRAGGRRAGGAGRAALARRPPAAPPRRRGAELIAQGVILSLLRGKGIVSRTWWRPQIQATQRSTPMPKPACGTDP
jgi:hypothetical protein